MIPRAISVLLRLAKEKQQTCLHKNSCTFYFSVEQHLETIFQPKRLLNVRSESHSFLILYAVLFFLFSVV